MYFEAVPKNNIDKSRVHITSVIKGEAAVINIETGVTDEVTAELKIGIRDIKINKNGIVKIYAVEIHPKFFRLLRLQSL